MQLLFNFKRAGTHNDYLIPFLIENEVSHALPEQIFKKKFFKHIKYSLQYQLKCFYFNNCHKLLVNKFKDVNTTV